MLWLILKLHTKLMIIEKLKILNFRASQMHKTCAQDATNETVDRKNKNKTDFFR